MTKTVLTFLWRELRISAPMIFIASIFLSFLFKEKIWMMAVHALCVGLCMQTLIELGRHGGSYFLRKHTKLVLQKDFAWPGWPFMFVWIPISCVGGYLIGGNIALLLTGDPRKLQIHGFGLIIILGVCLITALMSTLYLYSRNYIASMEARNAAIQHSATESHLRLLQSQLEPHMLFNTLANLRVLIEIDTRAAQDMLDHLNDFLRSSLNGSRTQNHSLEEEFRRIQDYLALMKIRMRERLQVEVKLPPVLAHIPVPAMILQPLVENAIKHGLEPTEHGGMISIRAERLHEHLHLYVEDNGSGTSPSITQDHGNDGYGLQHVRERLQHMYGDKASLDIISPTNGGYCVHIQFPITQAPAKS